MIEQKGEIIKLFNKESQYGKAIEKLCFVTEKALENISTEIKFEFDKKGYEKNKVKRLEHIIIKKRMDDISYETALDIVNQILAQNILDEKGYFIKDLFKKIDSQKSKTKENKEEKKLGFNMLKYFMILLSLKILKKLKIFLIFL